MSQLAAKMMESYRIVLETTAEHQPIKIFAGFSGGGDSSVLAHWSRHLIDGLFHIDTGTSVPGVRTHCERVAQEVIEQELVVYSAGTAYQDMVIGTDEFWEVYEASRYASRGTTLKDFVDAQRLRDGKGVAPQQPHGFPGPGGHGLAYTRLKERCFEALRRDVKTRLNSHRNARVMMLTGVRRAESTRRSAREHCTRRGSLVFVNPLINWTEDDMSEYKARYELPQSDVSALIHMSGECTCGAFADDGEREMLKSLWPEWWEDGHGALEREAEARGIRACVWGRRPPKGESHDLEKYEIGPFCNGCEFRRKVVEEAA